MGLQALREMSQVSAHGLEMWKVYQPSRCCVYSPASALFIPAILGFRKTFGVEGPPFHQFTLP